MMISSIFCYRILKILGQNMQLRIQYLHMAHSHINTIYLNKIEIFHIEFEFVDFNITMVFLDSFLIYTLINVSYILASVLFYIVYIGERKYRMFESWQDDEFPMKLISYRETNQTSATSNFCHNRREKKCYWQKT